MVQKAHTDKPTDETAAALKAAKESREALEATRQAAEKAATAAQKDVDAANREVEAVLTQKKPGLDLPVKELMEKTFARYRDDPNFYMANRAAIAELVSKSDAAKKAAFAASCKRYETWGLLMPVSGAVRSRRTGEAPVAERLTSFEKDLLRRFQGELLAQQLYPKFLTSSFTPNFIDQRLAARKEWRDIFKYDDAGKITGWTRIDATGSKEYNADGRIVLERDDKGRPAKARNVNYPVDWIDRRADIHSIKPTPGDTIAIYEYGPDGKGKVVREEKVEEKK